MYSKSMKYSDNVETLKATFMFSTEKKRKNIPMHTYTHTHTHNSAHTGQPLVCMHTHALTPHTLLNPQSQSVCRTPSHLIPRDNASSKCTHPDTPPLISTLRPALSPLLLSTCYPPLCLSHSNSVLLIPSEKKRQSRKSPPHLCHTLPRSLLSLAPVSC